MRIASWLVVFALMVGASALSPAITLAAAPGKAARAAQLDTLFARLKVAASDEDARRLEQEIWAVWNESGRQDVNDLMAEAKELAGAGQLMESLRVIEKVIGVAPDYAEGWNRKATVLFMMGRDRDSAVAIQRTLALEPRHFGALAGLTIIFVRAANWKGALAVLTKALAINPRLRERALLPGLKRKVEGRGI